MKNKSIILKKLLKIVPVALIFIIPVFFLAGCLAPAIPEITFTDSGASKTIQNTITVSGSAYIKILPDEAFINISAITEKPTSQEAVDQNSTLSKAIIDAVKATGAQNLAIQTTGYDLSPLYDYSKESAPPEIYAYRVTSTIEAKTTELEKIGEIIASATGAGANSISSIGFDLTDATKRKAKNDALAAATIDANDKAIAIANAMGLKIDSVLYIIEDEVYFGGPFMAPAGMGEARTEDIAAPVILPREIEVSANISVAYLFIK